MSSVDLGNGISLEGAGGHVVRSNAGGRRGPLAAEFAGDEVSFAVDDALREAEFVIAADTTIVSEPTPPGRRGFAEETAAEQPEVHVTVEEDENAVLLLENAEGVFRWQFADSAREEGPSRRSAAPATLTFTLAPPAAGEAAGGRRGLESVVGWVGDRLVSPIRVRVLRFVAAKAIDAVIARMEGSLATGLVVLHGNQGQWAVAGTPPQLAADMPARVLLLVHGTFSTTLGSYAGLEASEDGRAFLARARQQYDAVIGFDHRTLGQDPEQNAKDIMAALAFLPANSQIDAVAFSRGGLVYRALAERIAPVIRPDLFFGRAVFVGCTNSGTLLAEPDNWKALVDLYTNIGVAGARALSLFGSPVAGTVVTQAIKLLGGFVQALPELAIAEKQIPGLAAMEPNGDFVQALNALPSPLERYYAVVSEFEPRIDLSHGLTGGLVMFLADRVVDRGFGEANDLVVHTASMTRFGEDEVLDSAQVYSFAPGQTIYHTIYFLSKEMPGLLTQWLMPPLEGAAKNGGPHEEDIVEPALPAQIDTPDFDEPVAANGGGGRRSIDDDELEAAPFDPGAEPVGAEPPPPAQPRETVPCHFAAEMNPTPRLGSFAPLFVTVSRQALRVALGEAAAATEQAVRADPSQPLTIEVLALANCRVWSDEADPATPENGASVLREIAVPDKSDVLRFLVEGAEPGVARVQIEVTQGPHGLVSFILEPTFVDPEVTRLTAERVAVPIQPDADYPAVLRIYEQKVPGVGLVLKYDLACIDPKIAVKEDVILPESFSVGAFASEFLQALNDAWQLSGQQYDAFKQKIADYSVNRTNELIPLPLRQALWDNWDKLEAIQVFAENPYIPWELLYIDDPSGQNPRDDGFLGQRGLVRWVYNAPLPGDVLRVRGDRVRYVIPDYRNPKHKLANAQAEKDLLGALFPEASAIEPTSEAVRKFLAEEASGCDLLHFSCHGDTELKSVLSADLLMRGIDGAQGNVVPDKLSAETVKRYARFAEDGPATLVFINACDTGQTGPSVAGVSGFADSFLRPNGKRGAAAFIGALWSVDDKLALGFAREFYGAMVDDGLTLVEAVKRARQAAQTRSDFTWLAYTVYGNPLSRIEKE